MLRALLGLVKGLIVGVGLSYALLRLGFSDDGGAVAYFACAGAGALAGLVCGRLPWRSETLWTPAMKALMGAAAGAGLYAAGHPLLPNVTVVRVPFFWVTVRHWLFLAPVVGGLYGLFVEVDDGGSAGVPDPRPGPKQ